MAVCGICGGEFAGEDYEREVTCFGKKKMFMARNLKCVKCGEEVYDDIFSDENQENALKELKKELLKEILEGLKSKGIKLVDLERDLQLPCRTISRWKHNGDIGSPGIVMLYAVLNMPCILEMAQGNFEKEANEKALDHFVIEYFLKRNKKEDVGQKEHFVMDPEYKIFSHKVIDDLNNGNPESFYRSYTKGFNRSIQLVKDRPGCAQLSTRNTFFVSKK